jgi:hypothetical protein
VSAFWPPATSPRGSKTTYPRVSSWDPTLFRARLRPRVRATLRIRHSYDASVAQVVFPKIIKAGLLFGGTYGEGYLVRDGIILSQVRLAGGNAGLNAGAQSYSQVVYILDDDTLAAFRRGGKLSLHGTLNYARRGESVTNTFGKLSPTQPLYTTIFNQSGLMASEKH